MRELEDAIRDFEENLLELAEHSEITQFENLKRAAPLHLTKVRRIGSATQRRYTASFGILWWQSWFVEGCKATSRFSTMAVRRS